METASEHARRTLMQSKAATVDAYLAELPEDRREVVQAVREKILANLPAGYEEGMQYGMIGYFVPHSIYPPGYHCDPKQPLPFASLASQKNYISVYQAVKRIPVKKFIQFCESAIAASGRKRKSTPAIKSSTRTGAK
jgi:hypothetical protein